MPWNEAARRKYSRRCKRIESDVTNAENALLVFLRSPHVDLAASGKEIHQRLLDVVEPHPEHEGMGFTDYGSVHASYIPEWSVRKIGPTKPSPIHTRRTH